MFLDGDGEMEYHDNGPNLQHFRSTSLSEIFLYLQQQWEACCNCFQQPTYGSMDRMGLWNEFLNPQKVLVFMSPWRTKMFQ